VNKSVTKVCVAYDKLITQSYIWSAVDKCVVSASFGVAVGIPVKLSHVADLYKVSAMV